MKKSFTEMPTDCPQCGRAHDAQTPHCWGDTVYMTRFQEKHGRLPTWGDAMANLDEYAQARWRTRLLSLGVREIDLQPSLLMP